TPTFESVADVGKEPTVAAVPTAGIPTQGGAPAAASGALSWRDQVLRNDQVIVAVTGLPAPQAGQVYAAWLGGADKSLPLGKLSVALGLRQETDELQRHAQFLKDAFDAGDFRLVKVHAEHIANIIEGSEAHDINGDGKVQNPGDGFGLLPNGTQDGYIKGMV